jgi:putative transcriptional regulator
MTHSVFSIDDLTGKMLIAMPGAGDPRFKDSVILICAHTKEQGAMGLVLNKSLHYLTFQDMAQQMGVKPKPSLEKIHLFEGGPVESNRGFVLHSPDYSHENTIPVTNTISMTATADIIRAIALQQGPKDHFIALGYSGWESGQLEAEMMMHGWLVAKPCDELIFDIPTEMRWQHLLQVMGLEPHRMNNGIGVS